MAQHFPCFGELPHRGQIAAQGQEATGRWLQFQRGEIQSALESLNHSQKLYASLEDVQGQSQVDYYSGVIYGHLKEWQRAAACFERYLEVCETLSLEEGCASALIELGNLYRLQRDWPRAVEYLEQGIERAPHRSLLPGPSREPYWSCIRVFRQKWRRNDSG